MSKRDPSQPPPSGWVSRKHINDYENISEALIALESWLAPGHAVTIKELDNGEYRLFFDE